MAIALRSTLNEPPKSKLLYYPLLAVYFEQYLHAGGIVATNKQEVQWVLCKERVQIGR